jgi:acetyl-CoA carboxylase biotin carboxylase subunit
MLKKVLVANRGEIAVRIVRACHDLGIIAAVAYSEADRDSLAVRLADEAICIGPAVASHSYLNTSALISAARVTGCDAIHPGYGFLAENARFAAQCQDYGLVFVGPHAQPIQMMSNKMTARQAMQAAGVPIVPGASGNIQTIEQALALANRIGYPLMIKPSMGGGGRGLRVVTSQQELVRAFSTARAEAETAFGNSALLLEKYLPHVRHVEIQVLADSHGNAVFLGERDCSLQRRHQKIAAEAPSPAITPELREQLGDIVLRGIRSIGYNSAGTLEFLVDPEGAFYFIEMNPRIQVEHGVTEMVTGIDLVAWQLLIAGGERLSFDQSQIRLHGHAIECRIHAEDPGRDFLPVAGTIEHYLPPGGPGVRVDSHLFGGYETPRYYDSLLANLLVWGHNRQQALERMRRALSEYSIMGLATSIPFLQAMLNDPVFQSENISTRYVAEMLNRWQNAA